ncbi:hypothetical protein [Pseudomonas sp. WS 5532]|uniref:hypothetical protein n=1 Tax=Pseudomonas sp. WS 5532 TaxID=2717495 RepID=UPI0014739386|nr:hypothetical protein [Pseudomonas sp. WS 5532]
MMIPLTSHDRRGITMREVKVIRAFDFPIAGKLYRFAIHPPAEPIDSVSFIISEFKTGRQCGVLQERSLRRLRPAAEKHLAQFVESKGAGFIASVIEQGQAVGTLNDF